MKRLFRLAILALLFVAAVGCWLFYSQATSFDSKSKYFLVHNTDKDAVMNELQEQGIIKNKMAFNLLASLTGTWHKLKPGKYEAKKRIEYRRYRAHAQKWQAGGDQAGDQ